MATTTDRPYGIQQGAALTRELIFSDLGLTTPLSVAAGGTLATPVIETYDYKYFALGATASGALSVSVQEYLDVAGTVPQGAALTASVTAAGALNVNSAGDVVFRSIKITFSNSGTAAVTLDLLRLVLRAM